MKSLLKMFYKHSFNQIRGLERSNIFRHCFEFSSKNKVQGDILEFGCYEGESMKRMIASVSAVKKFNKSWNPDFWIFDSFRGLPSINNPNDIHPAFKPFAEGSYAANIRKVRENILSTNVEPKKLHMIEGFFEDSLKNMKISPEKISVAHIDVDLYSSCKEVLEFLTDKIQDGTLLIFDDYYCFRGNPQFGVPKAINEWQEKNKLLLSEYCNYSWAGKVFITHV